MAFHVACPFTCRKVCFCTLGTPVPLQTKDGRSAFLQNAKALQNLLSKPRLMLGGAEYVEVLVPHLQYHPKKALDEQVGELADDSGDDGVSRRAGSRRKASYSVINDSRQHASRDTSANGWVDWEGTGILPQHGLDDKEFKGEEHFQSLVPQIVCGLCGCGETIGSEKAGRMLSCQACRKQMHRKCTKRWGEHRDLFNWGSWICSSCRSCEACKRTGDSTKLMFCKRCDQAYHSHCLQPPLKHVPKGPFVCPKHVRCTTCNTSIPGGGVSSKWFLSYSLCDACGRLFTRGKYCPICLKVYRDSEPAPMVCCDVCEHWVHCECDGISEEKYQEYQVNDNLHYKCASCRDECYKVADIDEAALEIWRRKDVADATQIAAFRAASGLPSQEEMLKAYPSSDEDERLPEVKEVEEVSKKPTKKKVKKVNIGMESLGKNNKVAKIATTKDGPKSKSTPSKSDGPGSKPKVVVRPVTSEKNATSTKSDGPRSKPKVVVRPVTSEKNDIFTTKSKNGLPSSGGKGEGPQGKDFMYNSDAKETEVDIMKSESHLGGEPIAEVPKKDKKKKIEGSKEQSANKKKRTSKSSEPDGVKDETPKEESGKVKKLKFSTRQEIPDRHFQMEAPSTSVERNIFHGGSLLHGTPDRSGNEGVPKRLAKEGPREVMSARYNANLEEEGLALHSKGGAIENFDTAQQNEVLRGTSPLHWGRHSESVRRRRLPSSKYRDMDTSAWRQSWSIRDLPLTQNPELGPAQIGSEQIQEAVEAATKDKRTPVLTTASDARKERWKRPEGVEDNIDNDDSLDAPRKRLKVAELGETKTDSQSSPAISAAGIRGPLRLKIRNPGTPGTSKDSKKSEEREPVINDHQPSKKKRSSIVQKGFDNSGHRQLVAGDTAGDDSWILQRLGADAVSKRVEIFWPIDKSWYKGTVMAVLPEQLQFVVHYDDGEKETLNLGKERVRLLSTNKKS